MSSAGGYDPKATEAEIYAAWEAGGFFHATPDPAKQPYVITIPPPNVTGALHLGHALNNTLQDILIRRKRMQGFNACWLPGTDHAGIATQAVVEKRLREEQGWRRDPGNPEHRELLVKKIWEWKEEYNTRILDQLRRMGCSCDWQRTRFTLDEQCAKAVYETFFRFFSDGLIYRGLRLVNWDTQLQTAVADDEVYHETVRTSLWHIRYPIVKASAQTSGARVANASAAGPAALPPDAQPGRDYLVVATTRPETMLADTAVAVHPEDDRYCHLVGGRVSLPLTGRTIPIVADGMLVKREFGTGCVKVTPGHDPNDFACYQRKLDQADQIGVLDLLTPDGRIRDGNGVYSGMKKDEARKKVVADLEAAGLLEKTEPYETEVGHSDRSKTPIEPLRSEQWFVKMDKLADTAMEAVRDGRVRFFPERYAKTYLDWLGEKRDWCISRQLWWGHRIPVWTVMFRFEQSEIDDLDHDLNIQRDSVISQMRGILDSLYGCPGYFAFEGSETLIRICGRDAKAQAILANMESNSRDMRIGDPDPPMKGVWATLQEGENADSLKRLWRRQPEQDPDVLDTWFSSALWPHSTFGWPGDVNDLDYFYPTSVLSTAREIITLWVARMVMTGLYNVGRVPFQHVYIHAVIQDGHGRRMSKSAGNGVDPLDIIDAYGADALRFTLAQLATETQDIRIPVKPAQLPNGRTVNTSEKFELGRNLVTKLWQAATGFVIPTCKDVRVLTGNTDSKMQGVGPGGRTSVGLHTSRPPGELPLFEKWIRVKLLACIREVDRRIDRYEFSAAVDAIRSFFWNDLCDWYIEEVKSHLRDAALGSGYQNQEDERNDVKITLLQVFDIVLCLFHPAMPFVTEAIWKLLGREIPRHFELIWPDDRPLPDSSPMLIAMPWPVAPGGASSPPHGPSASAGHAASRPQDWLDEAAAQIGAEREVDNFLSVIRALREIRTSLNAIRSAARQPALRSLPAAVVRCDAATAALLCEGEATIARMGQVEKGGLTISPDSAKPPLSMSRVLTAAGTAPAAAASRGGAGTQTIEVYVPIAGLADIDIERTRLAKERDETAAAIERLRARLTNEAFVSKAKPEVVEAERARMAELNEKLATVGRNLAELG